MMFLEEKGMASDRKSHVQPGGICFPQLQCVVASVTPSLQQGCYMLCLEWVVLCRLKGSE